MKLILGVAIEPVTAKVPLAGVGEGADVGANVELGLTVGLRLGEGDAGLPPHPAMASTRTNAANARPVERLALPTPGLALTPCLPLLCEPLQDDASGKRA